MLQMFVWRAVLMGAYVDFTVKYGHKPVSLCAGKQILTDLHSTPKNFSNEIHFDEYFIFSPPSDGCVDLVQFGFYWTEQEHTMVRKSHTLNSICCPILE